MTADTLWQLGIPVVPVDLLPAPGFQGMACVVEGRPVILLGQKHDAPGRVAFIVAHEVGHIAAGDCAADRPVVDEEEVLTTVDIEARADRFATQFLVGNARLPELPGAGPVLFKELARHAIAIERDTGADASFVAFSWAHKTGDFSTAAMAVKALYRSTGAQRQLHRLFDQYVDVGLAAETERCLLRCVHDDAARHEAAR